MIFQPDATAHGLLAQLPPTAVWASYVFVNSAGAIGLLAGLAFLTHNPFVFPSLGPTAYLFFFTPLAQTASPRNAVLGHAVALCCGWPRSLLPA
jgi:CBS domain-containing membrane protein